MKNIIEIEQLQFGYGDDILFKNLNLEIKEKSFITITGSNGSGKSTLAKLLYNLFPYRGNIKMNSININKDIGYLEDLFTNSFDTETSYEMMYYYLKNKGMSNQEIIKRINEIITNLKLNDIVQYNYNHLSIGEKQLLSLACILASEPKIIIIDNATSMLDEIQKECIFKNLKKLNRDKKTTIIHFTSNQEDTIYGTDIVLLHKGEILLNEKTKKALLEEKKFKECNLELPFMASLSLKLKYYGLIDDLILDMNKMVNKLWK